MKLHRITWWSIYRKRPQFYWLYLCDFIALHIKKWFISPPSHLGLFWPIECSRSEVPVLKLNLKRPYVFLSLGTLLLPLEQGQANLLNNEICSSITSTCPSQHTEAELSTWPAADYRHVWGHVWGHMWGSPCGTKAMWSWEEPSSWAQPKLPTNRIMS